VIAIDPGGRAWDESSPRAATRPSSPEELLRVVKKPELREKLKAAGYNVSGRGPEAFRALIREELPKRKEVVTSAGIKPQ
jgi:tripartite-type tricarboxylate transporter receptor subunit TctC